MFLIRCTDDKGSVAVFGASIHTQSCDEITGSFSAAKIRVEHGCEICAEDKCNDASMLIHSIAWTLGFVSLGVFYTSV